jgi:hypothetical protein
MWRGLEINIIKPRGIASLTPMKFILLVCLLAAKHVTKTRETSISNDSTKTLVGLDDNDTQDQAIGEVTITTPNEADKPEEVTAPKPKKKKKPKATVTEDDNDPQVEANDEVIVTTPNDEAYTPNEVIQEFPVKEDDTDKVTEEDNDPQVEDNDEVIVTTSNDEAYTPNEVIQEFPVKEEEENDFEVEEEEVDEIEDVQDDSNIQSPIEETIQVSTVKETNQSPTNIVTSQSPTNIVTSDENQALSELPTIKAPDKLEKPAQDPSTLAESELTAESRNPVLDSGEAQKEEVQQNQDGQNFDRSTQNSNLNKNAKKSGLHRVIHEEAKKINASTNVQSPNPTVVEDVKEENERPVFTSKDAKVEQVDVQIADERFEPQELVVQEVTPPEPKKGKNLKAADTPKEAVIQKSPEDPIAQVDIASKFGVLSTIEVTVAESPEIIEPAPESLPVETSGMEGFFPELQKNNVPTPSSISVSAAPTLSLPTMNDGPEVVPTAFGNDVASIQSEEDAANGQSYPVIPIIIAIISLGIITISSIFYRNYRKPSAKYDFEKGTVENDIFIQNSRLASPPPASSESSDSDSTYASDFRSSYGYSSSDSIYFN